MSFQRIKDRFIGLSMFNKIILVGSSMAAISVMMPWYEDLDAFRTGDVFLGISGPLYLAGLLILIASAASISLIVFKALDKKAPRLPMQESHTHIAVAALNIFLLVFVNSVYFHSKFGVNIAYKEIRFGMVIAFIGSILLLSGAILAEKSKQPDFESEEGRIEPLIEMKDMSRSPQPLEQEETNFQNDPEPQADVRKEEVVMQSQQAPTPSSPTSNPSSNSTKNANAEDSQPWRMDL